MENKNEKRAALLAAMSDYAGKLAELVAEFNKLGMDDPAFQAFIHRVGVEACGYDSEAEIFSSRCGDLVKFDNYEVFADGRFPRNPHERFTMLGKTRLSEIGNFEKEMQA